MNIHLKPQRVIFGKWQPGFNKVQFNKLLRNLAGYSLATAKQAVDDLLEGHPIKVDIDRQTCHPDEFILAAAKLGVVGKIDTAPAKSAFKRGWRDALQVLNHQRLPYLDPDKDTWTTLGYRYGLQNATANENKIEKVWQTSYQEQVGLGP